MIYDISNEELVEKLLLSDYHDDIIFGMLSDGSCKSYFQKHKCTGCYFRIDGKCHGTKYGIRKLRKQLKRDYKLNKILKNE